jgi:hypothetical protein
MHHQQSFTGQRIFWLLGIGHTKPNFHFKTKETSLEAAGGSRL